MEQIVIRVNNKKNTDMLFNLLRSLDFVESVKMDANGKQPIAKDDFFAMAGIWKDRDIDQASIRQAAWPSQEL